MALVVVSLEEKLAGVCRFRNGKRFSFPVDLPLDEDPVEAVCADLDSNGLDEVFIVVKERYDYELLRFLIDDKGRFSGGGKIELKGVKRDPSGLFPCDLNCDGNLDLLILVPRGPALILLGDGTGKLIPAAESSAIRKSMLADLLPSQIGFADVNNDEKEDLLVAGSGFIRALTLKEGELKVIDQFNSRSGKGDLLTPFALDVLGNPDSEVLFYSSDSEGFEALSRDADGVFRHARSFRTGRLQLRGLLKRKVAKSKELLAFDKGGFLRIQTKHRAKMPVLNVQSTYLTDLRNISHDAVDCGDFDSDGRLDLLCLDASRHLLEFLRFDVGQNQWQSVLRFHVFEKNMHYQGRKGGAAEPREGLVVDLNGDDKDDFVLLAHDRLLCYYQE